MKKPKPYDSRLINGQEHLVAGGSIPTDEMKKYPYRPQVLTEDPILGAFVNTERDGNMLGTDMFSNDLGVSGPLVLKLSKLDPVTWDAIEDVQILGTWDGVKRQIIRYPGRNLFKDIVELNRARGIEIPNRISKEPQEGESTRV